ncbi:hypothetical protein CLFE_023620 [Clostridium felsineum DSM 794]|nr:hypothetical protein CLFE_023620 [Clostridium felsineum DSM 794]
MRLGTFRKSKRVSKRGIINKSNKMKILIGAMGFILACEVLVGVVYKIHDNKTVEKKVTAEKTSDKSKAKAKPQDKVKEDNKASVNKSVENANNTTVPSKSNVETNNLNSGKNTTESSNSSAKNSNTNKNNNTNTKQSNNQQGSSRTSGQNTIKKSPIVNNPPVHQTQEPIKPVEPTVKEPQNSDASVTNQQKSSTTNSQDEDYASKTQQEIMDEINKNQK